MNAVPGTWRRLAVNLGKHAAWVLPGAPWADAMRRELDYIGDDPAALQWALGCVVASYRARLSQWFSLRPTWRQVATSGALMVLIGLALQENAGGQTQPPWPACDEPGASRISSTPETGSSPRPAARSDGLKHDPTACEAISATDRTQEQEPRSR